MGGQLVPLTRRFRRAPLGKGSVVPEAENGIYELTTLGFQRLVRDCRLLDNSISVTDVDTVFTRVDGGAVHVDSQLKGAPAFNP
jgi:hypothetical protein